jgi:hypothetical protein
VESVPTYPLFNSQFLCYGLNYGVFRNSVVFSSAYGAAAPWGRVGLSALPSVYIISENAIERFRFICCPLKIMRGGIYFRPDNEGLLQGARLGKMPLGLKLSIKSRIESAVACASRSDPREIVSLVLAYWRTPNHQRQETQFRSSNSSASLRGANPFVPAWPKNLSCIC